MSDAQEVVRNTTTNLACLSALAAVVLTVQKQDKERPPANQRARTRTGKVKHDSVGVALYCVKKSFAQLTEDCARVRERLSTTTGGG